MQSDIRPLVVARDHSGIVEVMKNAILAASPDADDIAALKQVNELLKECATNVSGKIEALHKMKSGSTAGAMGILLLRLDNLQFMEPRGRFDTCFYMNGMTFENKNFTGMVLWQNAINVVCVLNTMTAKKDIEDLVVVHMEPEKINGKTIKNIMFAASRVTTCASVSGDVSGVVSGVIQELIASSSGMKVGKPSSSLFSSAKGAPFVRGYHGIQEGSIYLLAVGILFIKPVIFIPVAEVASVTAGRGGAANTRYIDLKVDTEAGDEYEFSNLERDELVNIQQYVQYLGALREKQEKQAVAVPTNTNTSRALDVDDLGEDDESDDDDYDPYAISDGEAGSRGREAASESGTDEDSSDEDSDYGGSDSDDSGFVSEGSVQLSGAEGTGPDTESDEADGALASRKRKTRSTAPSKSTAAVATSSSNVTASSHKWHADTDSNSLKRPKLVHADGSKESIVGSRHAVVVPSVEGLQTAATENIDRAIAICPPVME